MTLVATFRRLAEYIPAKFRDITGTVHSRPYSIFGLQLDDYWHKDGKLHRETGPAAIHYSPHTNIKTEEKWYRNGQIHRDNGPAYIQYSYLDGAVIAASWWKGDKRITYPSDVAISDTIDGPAP